MKITSPRDRLVGMAPPWIRRGMQIAFRPHARRNFLHEWSRSRAGVPLLPARPRRVVVICFGNICRSPFAEHLIAHRSPGLELRSAGLEAKDGAPAERGALRLAERFGIDLSSHRAHRMIEADVDWTDLILAMEGWQAADVEARWSGARGKVHLLGDFLTEGPFGIDDPYGGDDDVFAHAFGRIDRAVDAFLSRIDRLECGDGCPG